MKPDCKCVEQIIDRTKEHFPKDSKLYFNDEDLLSGRLSNSVTIMPDKRRHSKTLVIFHAYCPFCGKKYVANKEVKK